MYRYIVIIFALLIIYNFTSTYLKTLSYKKTPGVITGKIEIGDGTPSWYFTYKYLILNQSRIDTTKFGFITGKLHNLGDKVEVLYFEDDSYLNDFIELYFPNIILLIVGLLIHFIRGWFMEGYITSGQHK